MAQQQGCSSTPAGNVALCLGALVTGWLLRTLVASDLDRPRAEATLQPAASPIRQRRAAPRRSAPGPSLPASAAPEPAPATAAPRAPPEAEARRKPPPQREQKPKEEPCVDDPDFKDDLGNNCKVWAQLGTRHCVVNGDEVFFGKTADTSCCVCKQIRKRRKKGGMWGEPSDADYTVDEDRSAGCPTSIEYPYCGTLSKLPTSIAADGSLGCAFSWADHTHYLPSPRLLRCVQRAPPGEWDRDLERFHSVIDALQNPADCSKPWSLWRKEGVGSWHLARWLPHGHGFNLWMLSTLFGDHWDRGIPVLLSNSAYRFGGGSCGEAWSCGLSPISRKCSVHTVDHDRIELFHGGGDPPSVPLSRACEPHGRLVKEHGRCLCDKGYGTAGFGHLCVKLNEVKGDQGTIRVVRALEDTRLHDTKHYLRGTLPSILPNFANIGENNPETTTCPAGRPHDPNDDPDVKPSLRERHGFFWWHAAVLWYLFKSAPLRGEFESFVQRVGLRPSCVGIHVRRADACKDPTKPWRQCFKLEHYVAAARRMMRLYGLGPQIYLATDDPEALTDAREFSERFNVTFVYNDRMSRNKYVKLGDVGVDDNHLLDGAETSNEVHTDLWGLSTCGGFVGTFSSSLGWIAYALMTMRHGHYRPMASLDISLYNPKEGFGKFVVGNRLDKSFGDFWHGIGDNAPPRPASDYTLLTGEAELLGRTAPPTPRLVEPGPGEVLPPLMPLPMAEPDAEVAGRCAAGVAQSNERGVALLTAVTGPFMAIARARGWSGTLWDAGSSEQRRKRRLPLWVAHENQWDVLHGRDPLRATELPQPLPSCWFDVFEASPRLLAALRDPDSPLERIPRIPGTPSLSDTIIDGKALVRKVVAWIFAAQLLNPGTVLVWLDVDVTVLPGLSLEPTMAWARKRDVAYLPELPCWREAQDVNSPWEMPEECWDWRIDTGVVFFHLTAATRQFLASVLACYEGYTLHLAQKCLAAASPTDPLCRKHWVLSNLGLNDIYAFALKLHQSPGLRHGWLPSHNQNCPYNDVGGMCHPCPNVPGKGNLVCRTGVPFRHNKGGTGVMAQQHFMKKTFDPSMRLPPAFFAHHHSHIDKRLACGDSHSRYASAKQLAATRDRTPFLRIGW
eukprot:TRINITY_DN46801_c0_g1_i1.p1 TRINITY_DN46801_c0_g1~~TRINITY_DN46801_c0_g1_i1.p1  ORF type:complete len:1162 (+),score=287.86 TRINITY_DN46801_c0_g1_i1:112-3486(+)